MNKSWTNGESWKRPPASNELTSLITRSIANTIRAVSPAGPSWQPLPSKTPIIGTSVKSETWRSAGVAGESWRSFERGSKSETWRRGERRERGSGVSDRRKESEDRHARSRERSRSPPPRRRREHIGRKSSRWQPLSREEEEQRERAARKSSFDRRTTNMEGREVEGREEEESADDAADKLEPTCASTVDDAWEARLNAALERDVKCSLKSQTELDECQNPLHDDDFQNSLQIDDFQGAMSSLAPVQMPNDLIDLDYKLQPECHDEQPSRSLPGLKFRGAKRLIVSAFKLSTNDVRQYYCDEKFKSILANPPTLALSRLTCEELDEWKAEFPASLPVFKKRRGRTTASRIGRSVAASNQHKSRPSQKTARNSTENKQRSLNVDDCFDDDGDDDHTLSNGHQDDAKASVDGNQQKSLLKRPLARRRVPPPPREELPPGLDFLTPTQALPSFKIKKKVVVKEEKVEKKGRKYWRGSREEGRGRMMREHSREHSRDLSKEKPKIAKPLEGSVVDRAHDKKLVDSFFDRNLGHYRQAVRPKVKPPAAKIPDASVQKKESSWSKRENVKKVSEWLSRKPSGDRGPATPPGSGPDDESPAGAHLNYDVNLPAGTGVVDELLRKPLSKEEPLLAPNINPLDYVEELSNPGDDTDAIERQQFTDEAAIAEPSSSFVWTGTDDGGEERSASNKPMPIHHQSSHPSQHLHSTTRAPILAASVNGNAASFPYAHGRQPLIPSGLLPTPESAAPIPIASYRSGSVEPRPRSRSSGVRSASPMDLDDDCESASRSPQIVGRQALLGDRPRALLAVPPESSAFLSSPSIPSTLSISSNPTTFPRPLKQPLIPTPTPVPPPDPILPSPLVWRPKAPLLKHIVPERPRLNGPATKFIRPVPAPTGGSSDAPSSSSSQSTLQTTTMTSADDDASYTVDQLRTILNILLNDPSSSLQHDRRLKAEQLLAILDEVEAVQQSQSPSDTQSMLKPIVQFVLDSSGLLK